MSSNKSRFYIAYGSNLNLQQMKHRCPTAEVVGTAVLRNWKKKVLSQSPDVSAEKAGRIFTARKLCG